MCARPEPSTHTQTAPVAQEPPAPRREDNPYRVDGPLDCWVPPDSTYEPLKAPDGAL